MWRRGKTAFDNGGRLGCKRLEGRRHVSHGNAGGGAAIVTGLAGGNAVGGAAGAAIASIAAGKLNELSGAIAGADPPGNASMNEALGNIVANAIATGAGGAVGGNAGAVAGYDVDRFNRQLHPDEKTLAKQLAAKSNGQYTEAQIEDQMRIMGVSADGTRQSGAPDTLVGQAPTDSGARWISGGTSENGQPILTQLPHSRTTQCSPTSARTTTLLRRVAFRVSTPMTYQRAADRSM